MKRPQYVFRPNLSDPQHRRAWALLQQVPSAKRKEFLVQAILATEQTDRLEKSIRKVVREELQAVNITGAVPSPLSEKVKPEKREQFEQRHSRELILYDAAARYLKELKDSGEAITPKAWQREIDQLAVGKQTDTLAMKSMREDLKSVERLRKTAEQLSRQERDKSHDRGPER